MEVPKQGFVIKFGQNQQKERVQLKIAAWALCKESNVASEMGHNLVSSLFEAAPVKELKSEELKIEYVTQDVQKTLSSPYKEYVASGEGQDMLPCLGKKEFKSEELKKENQTKNKQKIGVIPCSAEGLKRKPIVCCEDGREKVKAEYEERNNLDASVALKLESKSVFGGLKVKREVKFGAEVLGKPSKKNTGLFGNFSQHRGGGGLPNSQNFCYFHQCLDKTNPKKRVIVAKPDSRLRRKNVT